MTSEKWVLFILVVLADSDLKLYPTPVVRRIMSIKEKVTEREPLAFIDGAPGLPPMNEVIDSASTFTDGQKGIFAMLALGLNRGEIAEVYKTTIKAVNNNKIRLAQKLGMKTSEAELLTVCAHASGWFEAIGKSWEFQLREPAYDPDSFNDGFLLLSEAPKKVLAFRGSGFTVSETASRRYVRPITIKNQQATILPNLLPSATVRTPRIHTAIAGLWLEGLIEPPK